MVILFIVLGVILVLEGIPYFAFPAKVRDWALALQDVSNNSLRIVGFISMVVGLLVLFLVKIFLL